MIVSQGNNRGRYSSTGEATPSISQSPTNGVWVNEDPSELVSSSQKSEWKRRLRGQPDDLGRWLCWKSKQAGCLTLMCFFIMVLLLSTLSYALVKVFTASKASTAPELARVKAVLQQEASREHEYTLSNSSFTPSKSHDLSKKIVCDSVHFIIEQLDDPRNAQLRRHYTQLLQVHSHWAEAFARHCFLSLHVEDVGSATPYVPFRAAGYLNALALEGTVLTNDDDFPWTLYTPLTTVPSNLFYGIHDLISLLSIGLTKRVSLLDRVCFHDGDNPGCAGSTRRGVLDHVQRPDGVDKIAMVLPLTPQMDGPPVVQHGSFLYQPSRLAGWFLDIIHRAAEVGTATADPLSWTAEHILGINEDVLQRLSLNPATEHIWQSACHGGDVVIARMPNLEVVKKWTWAQNITDAWFPDSVVEKSEPSFIVFVCSRVLESQACQKDVPDPMLKFTCGDFGANLLGCDEIVTTLNHEFGECHSLIPELMEKERERFRKHYKEHKRLHPAHKGRGGARGRNHPRDGEHAHHHYPVHPNHDHGDPKHFQHDRDVPHHAHYDSEGHLHSAYHHDLKHHYAHEDEHLQVPLNMDLRYSHHPHDRDSHEHRHNYPEPPMHHGGLHHDHHHHLDSIDAEPPHFFQPPERHIAHDADNDDMYLRRPYRRSHAGAHSNRDAEHLSGDPQYYADSNAEHHGFMHQ